MKAERDIVRRAEAEIRKDPAALTSVLLAAQLTELQALRALLVAQRALIEAEANLRRIKG